MLFELKSILFPWSFPIDIMHLYFENIAPTMYSLWSRKFFKNNQSTNCLYSYELNNESLINIGEIMSGAKKDMPIIFGRPPRNIFKHHLGYKASEWKNWIILYSLPLLRIYFSQR